MTETLMICQGLPRCELAGEDAIAAQKAGCPFCKRILFDEDDNEETIEPGNA